VIPNARGPSNPAQGGGAKSAAEFLDRFGFLFCAEWPLRRQTRRMFAQVRLASRGNVVRRVIPRVNCG
jgi:hypothetical protein